MIMIDEMIEKAANDYVGHTPEVDEGIEVAMMRKSFIDGAKWLKKILREKCEELVKMK